MKRIAAFEKVSFAQYEKDFADASQAMKRRKFVRFMMILQNQNGRQREAQAMTFLHRWRLC